jgi:U4/U6.U5 tri-snRNP component SNU23
MTLTSLTLKAPTTHSLTTMSDSRQNAYSSKASDTDFRRTWDKDEFARRARERESREREEGKARYEAKLAGKKYHRRASTPPDVKQTEARRGRIDVASMVGKSVLVSAGAAMGRRGKGAGFYCEVCDLTFKDNIALVEHYNSKQHLMASGESGEVQRATVAEVHERLRWLKRKRREEREQDEIGYEERIEKAVERDVKEREEKNEKRREKRRRAVEDRVKAEGGWE